MSVALESSDWRCPHATEESVPRCRGNQGAGACPMTPDFRIPGVENSENRLRRGEEEDDGDTEDPKRTAEWKNPREDLGTPMFPGRQRTPCRREAARRRAETATSQEGRG
ncbi:hypothetical protein NDU88_009380 [Pleurodeles waltl]|uniref:Uncharacterized protein n=1 Tax=Pleurodeles waltl TaxID=8319 RepID=A0AAV7PRY2_PLEWA|nr:hypothetical protein NDU88_009380 [Pleurodeles waltl]